MELYKTFAGFGRAEQMIEKSRFIASVSPAESREEAEAFIKSVREEFPDATHNVPAMVIGENMQIQWASDDGEPQGTAGAPIVRFLVGEGLTNAAVVVTRYFGGIKLGTGGLVRAYTGTAKLGAQAAGEKVVREMLEVTAEMGYTYLRRLKNNASEMGIELTDISYTDIINVTITADVEKSGEVRTMLDDLTAGTVKIVSERIKNS